MAAVAATKEMIGRQVGSITVSQVIVSEMISHKEEYYCAVKSTREGSEVLVANCGGIEVESNWDRVKRLCLDVGQQPSPEALEKLAKDAGFPVRSSRRWPTLRVKCLPASTTKMRNIWK